MTGNAPPRFDEHAVRQAINHLNVPRLRAVLEESIQAFDDLRERCLIAELERDQLKAVQEAGR